MTEREVCVILALIYAPERNTMRVIETARSQDEKSLHGVVLQRPVGVYVPVSPRGVLLPFSLLSGVKFRRGRCGFRSRCCPVGVCFPDSVVDRGRGQGMITGKWKVVVAAVVVL